MAAKRLVRLHVAARVGQGRGGTSPRRGVDQGLQVDLAPMAARLAPDQHSVIAGAQRRARCRQVVRGALVPPSLAPHPRYRCAGNRGLAAILAPSAQSKSGIRPIRPAATDVIGKVPPCRTVGRVASFRSETKGRVLQPPDMAQTASVTPLRLALIPQAAALLLCLVCAARRASRTEPHPESDGPFDCCLVGARSGARWPRHPRRVHGMAAARRLKNIGMRGRVIAPSSGVALATAA